MATKPQKLKGILKKPSGSSPTPPQTRSQADIERIALHHAHIIEQQKQVQAEVFASIETLSDFPPLPPSGPAPPASHPSPAAASRFRELVRPFQPGDYDDLMEERNVLGRCGYALCPNPRRSLGPGAGEFKLVNVNRENFNIVRRGELERWCSDACARRALYVKVQLSETPAWERVGLVGGMPVELLEEGEEKEGGSGQKEGGDTETGLARDMSRLRLQRERKAAEDSAALAVERGDTGKPAPERTFDVTIREKAVTTEAKPPEHAALASEQDDHMLLEGHKTRFGSKD